MNLNQVKPIHLRCPKCGYDFSYNTNHIEAEIDRLKSEIAEIKSQIEQFNAENHNPKLRKKNDWYRRTQAVYSHKIAELQQLKKARKSTMVEIKLQTFEIFKQIISDKYGKDEMIKLVEQAEEEMIYRDYDMAKQKFTKFEGA